jgi:hypothetical protein
MRRGDVDALADKRLSISVPGRQLPRLHRHVALFTMRSMSIEAEQ